MNKYYIITILAISLTSMTLRAADFEEFDDITEVETTGVAINVNGAQVHVTGAAGQTLEVYNIAGTSPKAATSLRLERSYAKSQFDNNA